MPNGKRSLGGLAAGVSAIVLTGWVLAVFGAAANDTLTAATAADPTPTASPTPDPFDVAEALALAGLRGQAVDAAVKALQADPTRTLRPETKIAIAGSSPLPTPSPDLFTAAEKLAAAGLRSDAIEVAKKALQADPNGTLGPRLNEIFDTERAKDPFAEARALAAAGFDEQAAASAREQLKQHPDRTLPPELSYLNGQSLRDFWSPERGLTKGIVFVADVRWLLGAALAISGAAVAIGLAVWLILLPLWRRATDLRFDVAVSEIEGKEENVSEYVPKIGGSLAVAVEAELQRLRAEGGSSSLSVQRTPDAPINMPPTVKDLPAQIGLVVWLLSLLPNRLYTLVLTLHPRSDLGVGITAAIRAPEGRIEAIETLWEKDYDPAYERPRGDPAAVAVPTVAAYESLAVAAASWAIYQPPIAKDNKPPAGVISANWRSYVCHRAATRWQDEGDAHRARKLYLEALGHDPHNWGSLMNLAYLDWDDLERTEKLLAEAVRLTELQGEGRTGQVPRSWYRIRYSHAVALLERALDGTADRSIRTASLSNAERRAVEVLSCADRKLSDGPLTAELWSFLQLARSATLTVLAGSWELSRQLGGGDATPIPPELPEQLRPPSGRREAEFLIGRLDGVPGGRSALHPSTRYNLASYFTQLGEAGYDKALDELKFGLAPGDAKAARDDLALKPLQQHRQQKFNEIVARYGEKKPLADYGVLAKVGLIGPKFAAELKRRGIETADQLERRTRLVGDRENLAADLEIARALVDEWATVLRLRVLYGTKIDIGRAELLYEVGLRDPDGLADKDAARLLADLRSRNDARHIVDELPTQQEVGGWIEAARIARPALIPIPTPTGV